MSLYSYANRDAIAFNMSKGDSGMQDLLKTLTSKELKILRNYEDLGDRVLAISKMDSQELIDELRDVHDLDIEFHGAFDIWISTEHVEDALPEWFSSEHYGWFRSQKEDEFLKWAKNFLLQEVRINIWIRYMEYKKDNPNAWDHFSGYSGYL